MLFSRHLIGMGSTLNKRTTPRASLALLATLSACAATNPADDLLPPLAASNGGDVATSAPDPSSETGGSSGTDGAGGRPVCVVTGDEIAPADTITTLGTLDQARETLQQALASAGPATLHWGGPNGGSTELSIDLISWQPDAKVDSVVPRCVLLGGEFHVYTSDGLLDGNVIGAFTYTGFEAFVLLDPTTCHPFEALCDRLPKRHRVLHLSVSADATQLRWDYVELDGEVASGPGIALPSVELQPVSGEQLPVEPVPPATPVDPEPTSTIPPPPPPPQPATCTDLTPGGSSVVTVFAAGAPPDVAAGGALEDGLYDLTSVTIYQSTPTNQGFQTRETLRISQQGTYLEVVNDGTSGMTTLAESIAPSGPALNPTTTCPLGAGRSFGPNYTATPGHFTLINGLYVKTYVLRSSP